MKPIVKIWGWPSCYPIVYDSKLIHNSGFDFSFHGGCSDLVSKSDNELRTIRDECDAIIIHSVGPPSSAKIAPTSIKLIGGCAKVAVWSMDCHVAGWAQVERSWSGSFDAWFVAHSSFMPVIGGKVKWMPCYLPYTPNYSRLTPEPENSLDLAFVGSSYAERDAVLNRLRGYMDAAGIRYFIGTDQKSNIPHRYRSSRVVLNINQNCDLNIRQFEALGAGRPVLMSPASDWRNPMFDDLRPFTVCIPRYPDSQEFKAGLARCMSISAGPARDIVLQKHSITSRYISIAKQLLQ